MNKAVSKTGFNETAEWDILRCCLAVRLDPNSAAEVLSKAAGALDWDAFERLVHAHRVVPLVYAALLSLPAGTVPPRLLKSLSEHAGSVAIQNLRLLRTLLALLELFAEHDIAAVPYKGPVLALDLYGDPGLRQSVDLDLFVSPEKLPIVTELLAARGYHQAFGGGAYHSGFVNQAEDVVVEVHWDIAPSYLKLADGFPLWRCNAVRLPIGGRQIPHFAREDLLLLLCIHGAKHNWSRLQWLCDIAELVCSDKRLDWTTVHERARLLGCEGILALGLLATRDLLRLQFPSEALSLIDFASPGYALAVECAAKRVAARSEVVEENGTENDLFRLRAAERPVVRFTRLLYLLQSGITPTDEDRTSLPLPHFLVALWYLWRPVRLAVRHWQRLMGTDRASATPERAPQ